MYSEAFLADLKSRVAISDVIGRSVKLRRDGKEFRAVDNASLTVNDAKALWWDHATNEGGDALDWLQKSGLSFGDAVADLASIAGVPLPNGDGQARQPQPKKQQKAIYDYTDAQGELIYQVVRLEWVEDGKRQKTFRQRRPDSEKAGEWIWNLESVKHGLYRLPELREAGADEIVFLPEGEKDVETLAGLGLVATTNSGGARNWRQDHAEALRGRDIVVLIDNDEPGRERGKTIVASLHGIARRVRLLDFSHEDIWPAAHKGADVTDWVRTREGTAEELVEIVESLPDAKPAAVAHDDGPPPHSEISEGADADRIPTDNTTTDAPPEIILPFETFDASQWEGVPIADRRWIVHHRIPVGEPGIMSGDGGTGKTKLALQLGAAVSAELPDWVGGVVETHGPVLVFSAEEKLKEMHRRMRDVLEHRTLSFKDLRGRLHFICDHSDPVLGAVGRTGIVQPTMSLLRLEKTVIAIRPALVVVENAADVYSGNESDRPNVTRFVRSLLGRLTVPCESTVMLIQHPSVAGLNDGTGRSGSTGWNNAGRWRNNFTAIKDDDDGLRQLEIAKNNYGPKGEKVRLRWERGVFVPEGSTSSPQQAAAVAKIDDLFLKLLDKLIAQGRRVYPYPGRSYAPNEFAEEREAEGVTAKAFETSMRRLLDDKKIVLKTEGPKSKRTTRIIRPEPPADLLTNLKKEGESDD